jgi:hypothetical protein
VNNNNVETRNGPMTVVGTRKSSRFGFHLVDLVDAEGNRWIAHVRNGKTVNRSHTVARKDA